MAKHDVQMQAGDGVDASAGRPAHSAIGSIYVIIQAHRLLALSKQLSKLAFPADMQWQHYKKTPAHKGSVTCSTVTNPADPHAHVTYAFQAGRHLM